MNKAEYALCFCAGLHWFYYILHKSKWAFKFAVDYVGDLPNKSRPMNCYYINYNVFKQTHKY